MDHLETTTLTVPDISCGGCERSIQTVIGDLPGVIAVEASAATKRVVVTFAPGPTDPARIAATLDEIGYPVEP